MILSNSSPLIVSLGPCTVSASSICSASTLINNYKLHNTILTSSHFWWHTLLFPEPNWLSSKNLSQTQTWNWKDIIHYVQEVYHAVAILIIMNKLLLYFSNVHCPTRELYYPRWEVYGSYTIDVTYDTRLSQDMDSVKIFKLNILP